MNKCLLFLLVIIVTNCAIGQSYLDYNIRILDAQNYLINQDFDSALLTYKVVFEMVEKPFPKDLENAALTAYYLDDIDLMKDYIKCSMVIGNRYKPVRHKFRHICKDNKFWKEMKNVSLDYIEKLETESDSVYFVLKEMLLNDQEARKSFYNKEEKMQVVDSINTIKLNEILNQSHYPGFLTIGIYSSLNTIVITDILMLHVKVNNYEKIIVSGLLDGEIAPNMALYLYIRQYKFAQNDNTCPTSIPDELKKCTHKYEKDKYEKIHKMGFDFNSIL